MARTPSSANSSHVGADAFVRSVERSEISESPDCGRALLRPSAATDECVRGYTGSLYDHPSEADRYEMIRTYFRMLIEEELPDAVGKMKQFASWFTTASRAARTCEKKSTNRKARRKFSAA